MCKGIKKLRSKEFRGYGVIIYINILKRERLDVKTISSESVLEALRTPFLQWKRGTAIFTLVCHI